MAMASPPGDEDPRYCIHANREYAENAVTEEVRHLASLYDEHWRLLFDVVTYNKERIEFAMRLLPVLVHCVDVDVDSMEVWQDIAHWVCSDHHEAHTRARALLTGIVHGPVSLMDIAADSQNELFLRMVYRSKMDLYGLMPLIFNNEARHDTAVFAAHTTHPYTTEARAALASLYAIVLSGCAKAVLRDREHWALTILSRVVDNLQNNSKYRADGKMHVSWESLWALAEITHGLTAQEKDELDDLLKLQGSGAERQRITDTATCALELLACNAMNDDVRVNPHDDIAYREAKRLLYEID